MLDEFKEEKIVNKVGGRFKLSSLIQKRLVALNRGARIGGHSGSLVVKVVATDDPRQIFLTGHSLRQSAERGA